MKGSGKPIFDEVGIFQGYRGTTVDYSAEAEAYNFEQRYSEAMESLSEGYAIWGPDERLIKSNTVFRKIHGDIAEHIVPGTKLKNFLKARAESGSAAKNNMTAAKWVEMRLKQMREGTQQREFERDGRWYLVSNHRLHDGSIIFLHNDVTTIKQSAGELRISEQRFKDIASSAADRIWEVDENFKYTYISEPTERMNGSVDAFLGRKLWETDIRWADPDQKSRLETLFKSQSQFSIDRLSWLLVMV